MLAEDEIDDLKIQLENYRERLMQCEDNNSSLVDSVHRYKMENIRLNSELRCKTEHPWWKFWW